jgi:hypothetical protein
MLLYEPDVEQVQLPRGDMMLKSHQFFPARPLQYKSDSADSNALITKFLRRI